MNTAVVDATLGQNSSGPPNDAGRETPADDCRPSTDQPIVLSEPNHEPRGDSASGQYADGRLPRTARSGSLVGSALVELERQNVFSLSGSSGTAVFRQAAPSEPIVRRRSAALSDAAASQTAGARSCASGGSGRPARDRRAYPRHESPARASVVLLSDDDRLSPVERSWKLHASRLHGTLVDVSMNGVALLLPRPLPPGQHVLLRLYNPHRDLFVDVSGRVLRNAAGSPGQCKVVCVLQRRLTWEEINALGKHLFSSSVV